MALTAVANAEKVLRGRRAGSFRSPEELQRIRNFLVLQYERPLGSVVHATPLFEALRRAVPDAYIAVAASPMAASVLERNPNIDHCEVTTDPWSNFARATKSVRRLVAAMPPGPCCIVTTIGNRRPRLAVLALLAGRGIRVGHTAAPELYDLPLTFQPERGQIEGNLDIVRALRHAGETCEPRIFFGPQEAEYAAGLLEAMSDGNSGPRIVFVTQNSGGQPTQWDQDRFRQVIGQLHQQVGAIPIFVGIGAEAEAIEVLRQPLTKRGISLAGQTTIAQLAAVFAQSDLVVSLDTGPFHVARAVGLPGVVLAPAWQSASEWLPVNHSKYRVLRGPSVPARTTAYRMEEIGSGQVVQAACEMLRQFPPCFDARAARVRDSLRG